MILFRISWPLPTGSCLLFFLPPAPAACPEAFPKGLS